MRARPAVSLVEVLVAAVLLAIGIASTMQALLASARLRLDADRREAMVGLMLDRLAWFETESCAHGDTSGVVRLADGPEARWNLRVVGATRELTLQGARQPGRNAPRSRIITSRPCS